MAVMLAPRVLVAANVCVGAWVLARVLALGGGAAALAGAWALVAALGALDMALVALSLLALLLSRLLFSTRPRTACRADLSLSASPACAVPRLWRVADHSCGRARGEGLWYNRAPLSLSTPVGTAGGVWCVCA